MVDFFRHNFYTRNGYKKVPSMILYSSNICKKSFINGYFSGDGARNGRFKNDNSVYTSDSATLLQSLLLLKNQIYNKFIYRYHILREKYHVFVCRHNEYTRQRKWNPPGTIRKIQQRKFRGFVYDISTDRGTFSGGIGNIKLKNTDGIYCTGEVTLEQVKKEIQNMLAKYEIKYDFEIEQEFFPQAYFLKMKNYMLYTEDNKIIPKGSSLKGKHKSKMFDLAIEKIADVIFRGKDVSWEQIGDISQYKKEDLLMRTTMSMAPEEYSNKNCLQMQLYRQALTLKMEPVPGTSFEYYKSVNGYMLSQNKSNAPPDHKYYGSIVKRILKLFDKNPKERSLSEFKPKKKLHEYM
jgi:hypothetical protein